ncbi:MAG: hypothetical protein NZ481_09660 [Candidatus Kapabacteria bacterium]|nr:hypothetical protein [Candidatus Kapabacteria bacterium]
MAVWFFVGYIARRGFFVFGVYRIIVGVIFFTPKLQVLHSWHYVALYGEYSARLPYSGILAQTG